MPLIPSDWGDRNEVGEGLSEAVVWTERSDQVTISNPAPTRSWWWDRQGILWHPRTVEDRAIVEAMEDFFAPYIALLSWEQGSALRWFLNDHWTYQQIADELDISRQAAHKKVKSAVQAVVRLIAEEDPHFQAGRKRDYNSEQEAMLRQLKKYWKRRFGTDDF